MKKIVFFDTTLRDGEQMPGVHLSRAHKVEIALSLEKMGVDIIEAGFPASSEGDFRACEAVSAAVKKAPVAVLARATKEDIDAAYAAVRGAVSPMLHIFIATSDIHLEHKLDMTREQVLERVAESVGYARSLCENVQFSPEDAVRTDEDFLVSVLECAINSGASSVNITDTVGYALPDEFGALVGRMKKRVRGIENVTLGVHCHDDLGCAVANSLSGIAAGASHVECTINGIGERAGNAALEEIVMTLCTRRDFYGVTMNINSTGIAKTARMVSALTGVPVAPNKAVVGSNAFLHESGIHQHGILSDRRTYEIMPPEIIGLKSASLVLGKHSGRHAFSERVKELGYSLDRDGIDICFERFKNYADRKKITDDDIMAIIGEYLDSLHSIYVLDTFQIQSGNRMKAVAMVTLSCEGVAVSETAVGEGPVDAVFNAIERLSGADRITLEEYGIKAVTEGTDALGEAMVKISVNGALYSGRGVSPDIIEASAKAYINALNKWAALSR